MGENERAEVRPRRTRWFGLNKRCERLGQKEALGSVDADQRFLIKSYRDIIVRHSHRHVTQADPCDGSGVAAPGTHSSEHPVFRPCHLLWRRFHVRISSSPALSFLSLFTGGRTSTPAPVPSSPGPHGSSWHLIAPETIVELISALRPISVVALAGTAFTNGPWMCTEGFLVPPTTLNPFWCAANGDGMCTCMYSSRLAEECLIEGGTVLNSYGYRIGSTGRLIAVIIAIIADYRGLGWLVLYLRIR